MSKTRARALFKKLACISMRSSIISARMHAVHMHMYINYCLMIHEVAQMMLYNISIVEGAGSSRMQLIMQ